METIISNLKCAFNSKRVPLKELSDQQLEIRKKNNFRFTMATSLVWCITLILTLLGSKMSTPLTIVFFGVVCAVIVSQWSMYINEARKIDEHLKK
jgi:hypothetical protein